MGGCVGACVLRRVLCVSVCCVGAYVVCEMGRVLGHVWGVGTVGRDLEKVSLAPLYYPETLVNSDTCLGYIE